jgi:hypothetical protein
MHATRPRAILHTFTDHHKTTERHHKYILLYEHFVSVVDVFCFVHDWGSGKMYDRKKNVNMGTRVELQLITWNLLGFATQPRVA